MAPLRIFSIMAWRGGMAAHHAGADLQAFLLRRLACPQNLLCAGGIGRKALFHKNVNALFHRILQVGRAEAGVRGQQGHVAGRRQSIALR